MKARLIILVIVLLLVAYFAYRFVKSNGDDADIGPPDARTAWVEVLSKCATTEFIGSSVFYFGASNTLGPGSVWRKHTDGSLRLRFDLNELESDPTKRAALIQEGNAADCSGQQSRKWSVGLGLPFESQIVGLGANLGTELKKARVVTVGVTAWSADLLRERAYEDLLRTKPQFADEFIEDDRLVAENAIKVRGFTSSFEFEKSIAAELKVELPGGEIILNNGTRLNAAWESATKLRLTSPTPFYILAGVGKLVNTNGRITFKRETSIAPTPASDERELAQHDLNVRMLVRSRLSPSLQNKVAVRVENNDIVLGARVDNAAEEQQIRKAAQATAADQQRKGINARYSINLNK
jgi:hypothetical protein